MERRFILPEIGFAQISITWPASLVRVYQRLAASRHSTLMGGISLYLLCASVLSLIIFVTPALLGTDDYYHVRIATQIIEQGKLRLDFPWLPNTLLNPEHFVDHHLLYHLYIAPWAFVGGINGAKLAAVSIAAGVFAATWILLRGISVSAASLWTLALFGISTPFLYRLLMIRTQGMALLLLILALHVLFQRRYRWLIPLAFAYTWLYNGFVLIIVFSALYMLGKWLTTRQYDWRPVVYTTLGVGLGLVINPYFPQNILFAIEHLGAKVDLGSSIQVGNEWYPYTTEALLNNSTGALILLTVGLLHASFNRRQRDTVDNTLLLAAFVTLFMVFQSRRFIEYFPAFALLFSAAAWGRSGPHDQRILTRANRYQRQIALIIVLIIGSVFIRNTVINVYRDAQAAKDVETFAGAAAWLEENTAPGSLVFQTDWDDFTRLFYYNTHNTYLVGLDPTYLQLARPDLWDQWVAITRGQIAQPSHVIYENFGSEYVVSDINHTGFINQTRSDPALELVFRDAYSYVWRVQLDRLARNPAS